uniref:VAN3-binding protein-like auxin canalisation domain-containing protein n=1 Tax=Arundo donax TaxID=35708 RepID=A0A0A8ZPR7_ARUDO
MHATITSAASLVAGSCAETAKSAGATREQVSSVIHMGLESRAMGDLHTLTTSAAA